MYVFPVTIGPPPLGAACQELSAPRHATGNAFPAAIAVHRRNCGVRLNPAFPYEHGQLPLTVSVPPVYPPEEPCRRYSEPVPEKQNSEMLELRPMV